VFVGERAWGTERLEAGHGYTHAATRLPGRRPKMHQNAPKPPAAGHGYTHAATKLLGRRLKCTKMHQNRPRPVMAIRTLPPNCPDDAQNAPTCTKTARGRPWLYAHSRRDGMMLRPRSTEEPTSLRTTRAARRRLCPHSAPRRSHDRLSAFRVSLLQSGVAARPYGRIAQECCARGAPGMAARALTAPWVTSLARSARRTGITPRWRGPHAPEKG